jgi:hypothetical protein
MSVRIEITRVNGVVVFTPTTIAADEMVFWYNNDSFTPEHAPFGLTVKYQGTSQVLQPYSNATVAPIPPPLPLVINYTCSVIGHETEKGTITVYNNLIASPPPAQVSPGTPGTPVATGGNPPYTFSIADLAPAGSPLTLTEVAATPTADATINAVLTNPATPRQQVSFTLNATDSMGNRLDQLAVAIIYDDFTLVPSPITQAATPPSTTVPVATGGLAPYTSSVSNVSGATVTLADTSGGGVSAVLTNVPATPATVTFTLTTADSLGVALTQAFTINLT